MPSQYKLRPSASARFLQCSKSLEYNDGFTESIHTIKGNLIHEVISLELYQIFKNKSYAKKIQSLKENGLKSKNDPKLHALWDNDCEETTRNAISYARKVVEHYKPQEIHIEVMLPCTFYGNKMNGKVDFLLLSEDLVVVIDWKTGRGKVETEDNTQMLLYAYAVVQDIASQGKPIPSRVIISVNQSIIYNVKAVKYTLKQMLKWYKDQSEQMYKINRNLLEYKPSEEACKYCQYKAKCAARIRAGIIA